MFTRLLGRRTGLLLLAVGVVSYSVAVLIHVTLSWDIGFQCFFSREIRQVTMPEPLEQAPEPHDIVTQIGPVPVRTYLDVQPAVEACQRRPADRRTAESPSIAALLHEIEQSYSQAGKPVPTDVQIGETRFVRVRVLREIDGALRPLWVWASVGRVPLRDVAVSVLWLLLNLAVFAVGAVVLWRRPGDRSSALFFELCSFTVGAFMGGFHWWTLIGHPVLLFPFVAFAMLLPAVSLHFYLVFPRPKEFFRRHPRLTLALVRGLPLLATFAMLGLMARVSWLYRLHTPDDAVVQAIARLLGWIKTGAAAYVAFSTVMFAGCLVALIHSFVSSRNQEERNQVKWILFGAALATLPVSYTLYLAMRDPVAFALGGATPPMFLASICFTLAFAVAIMKYRLMQVGEIINRSVVYFGVSTAVAILYYALLMLGSLWWGSQLPQRGLTYQSFALITAVVFILALLGWGLDRLRAALEQRFWRDKGQLDRAMRKMGEAIRSITDERRVAQRMLEAAADLLGVRRAAVYVIDADEEDGKGPLRLAASLGVPPKQLVLPRDHRLVQAARGGPVLASEPSVDADTRAALESLPAELVQLIELDGRVAGLLALGRRQLGLPFRSEEVAFLSALGQITALALEGARRRRQIDRLSEELREKVEQIAEQQRRILVLQSQLTTRRPASRRELSCETVLDQIRGSSSAVQSMLDMARKVAAVDATVLIRGESGTGKELLARAIHAMSPRAQKPFVAVHCAALSPSLLESELFGHVKGAFTGAYKDKEGRFKLADGGTLFLDEIGDISLEVQTKLLRVLQEMAFQPVGSSQTIKVDVRIVAATNQNLERLIQEGRFREDLFYRLNVITIYTPPLRERIEDLPELVEYFVQKFAAACGKRIRAVEDEVLVLLKSYHWPGNVRELENVIERAVVMCDGDTIRVTDFPKELIRAALIEEQGPATASVATALSTAPGNGNGRRRRRQYRWAGDAVEREELLRALRAAEGNKAEAARRLGMPRSTFISKLKKHGLA